MDHGTMWPIPLGSGSGLEHVPKGPALVKLLEGDFVLDVVVTEGVVAPMVERWTIRLEAVDTSLYRPTLLGRLTDHPVFGGTRTDLPVVTPLDSIRRGRFIGGEADIEMWIQRGSGNLRWRTAPGGLDGGRFFEVAEVDSSGFRGRWEDGGIAMSILRRGDLTVGEVRRGYYCARRTR